MAAASGSVHGVHEGAVDLELVDQQLAQEGQRERSRAEIVERHWQPGRQALQRVEGPVTDWS